MYSSKVRKKSALIFVLKGLIPYSQENVMLAFKPNRFFNDLEAISNYKKITLERAFKAAERQKLVTRESNLVKLTDDGQRLVRPFAAEHLSNQAQLMIIFDIPETMAVARAQLRRILRSWHFHQIQKSVWVTAYDHRQSLKELVAELELTPYIQIYECAPV